MFRQRAIINRQRRNINQIANVQLANAQTESYSHTTKKKHQPNSKCSEKTTVNRQRRNISQIANVQKKVRQTDRPANTAIYRQIYRQNSYDEDVDKVRPANTAENIDKVRTANISTKFAR